MDPVKEEDGEQNAVEMKELGDERRLAVESPLLKNADSKRALANSAGTSNIGATMHVIRGNMGAGVLAIPMGFRSAGLLLGSVSLWFMALVCVDCMHTLVACKRHVMSHFSPEQRATESLGYEDVVELVVLDRMPRAIRMARCARWLVATLVVIGQLGFCCVFLVFIPTSLKQVVEHYWPAASAISVQLFMCATLGPLILFCTIKDLKVLAPFSALANVFMLTSLGAILAELLVLSDTPLCRPLDQLDLVAAPAPQWPRFFNTAMFAFQGIALVLPVQRAMRHQERFAVPLCSGGVLSIAMSVVAALFYTTGLFGYMKYGRDVMPSITLNLPVEHISFQIIKVLITAAIFVSYNLQFYVAADILWSLVAGSNKKSTRSSSSSKCSTIKWCIGEHLFRTSLVVFTFALAVSVPRIDLFISLVGAITGATLSIMVPALMDIAVHWPAIRRGEHKLKFIKDFIIVFFGMVMFISGTYMSLYDIFDYFYFQFT